MLSQNHIESQTPMCATLVPAGGTTLRVWAPRATAVYLNGVFSGANLDQANATGLMQKSGNFWTGYLSTAGETLGGIYSLLAIRQTRINQTVHGGSR